jgi:hypothetical protein
MQFPEDGSFGRPSPVWKYWLAHCEGFTVESRGGRVLGFVESIGVDPAMARFVLLVRRKRLFRRRLLLSAERVSLVMPWSETLILGRSPERSAGAPARALAAAGAGLVFLLALLTVAGRRSGAAIGALGGRAYRRSPELVERARPLVRAAGGAGARGLRSGGRLGFRLLVAIGIGLAVLGVVFAATLLLLVSLLRAAAPVAARRVKAAMVGLGALVRSRAPAAAAALRKGWSLAASALVDAGPRVRTLPWLSSRR